MSLINDMLRDLDSRNAANSERNGLAQNVRALPPSSTQRHISPVLLMLGAALLGGGAVWFLLRPASSATLPQAATTQAAPAPTVTTAAAPRELAAPSVEAPPAETPPAAQEAPVLRLDTSISQPSAAKPEAQTPAPAALAQAQPTVAVTPATTRVAEPPRSNAPAQISKQLTGASSANEQAESEYRRGTAAIRRGDAIEGGEALRAALRASPTHVAARQALLAQLTEQQRWADAETLALDGVGLYPQRSDWALLAARLMYERGEASAALATLDQYASAARQNADYQILRALLLQRAGRNADAADCYQTALAIRPQEGRWWYGLGRALDADHREALARQAYEKARESGNLPPELQQAIERRLR